MTNDVELRADRACAAVRASVMESRDLRAQMNVTIAEQHEALDRLQEAREGVRVQLQDAHVRLRETRRLLGQSNEVWRG